MSVQFAAQETRGPVDPNLDQAGMHKRFTYIDDGSSRWPAARWRSLQFFSIWCWRKIYYHCVVEGVPLKQIMELFGKNLKLPVESKTLSEALKYLGFIAEFVNADSPTSSEKTKRELRWHPTGPQASRRHGGELFLLRLFVQDGPFLVQSVDIFHF